MMKYYNNIHPLACSLATTSPLPIPTVLAQDLLLWQRPSALRPCWIGRPPSPSMTTLLLPIANSLPISTNLLAKPQLYCLTCTFGKDEGSYIEELNSPLKFGSLPQTSSPRLRTLEMTLRPIYLWYVSRYGMMHRLKNSKSP